MRLLLALVFVLSSIFNANAQEELKRWFHSDPADGMKGISADKAYKEILKGKKGKTVVVAVIDSGIDIEHEDLKDVIWVNEDEIPGNGIDDDRNGYVDDVHGWNFIGGADGSNLDGETLEVTRLYAKYKYKFENANRELLNKKDKALYDKFQIWKEEVQKNRKKAQERVDEAEETSKTLLGGLANIVSTLKDADKAFNLENVKALEFDNSGDSFAKQIVLRFLSGKSDASADEIKSMLTEAIGGQVSYFKDQLAYNYNPDFKGREEIVKDNYADQRERDYGNNDVEGPDALHGTHVAGIIGALRHNGLGGDGVANNVKIMSIRAVPNGDERDKDIANAIRYAVENGAQVINMSFGKGFSYNKRVVDDAVKFAEKKDVLLVHAAGNSSLNLDLDERESDNFPNDKYDKPGGWWIFNKNVDCDSWIEVGALNYKTGDNQVAPFSNYGQTEVDVFAPGMKIYAPVPQENNYRFLQGTSMASPVVAGMAAVIRSYFPRLTANQVKEAIMKSAIPLDQEVIIPGKEEKTNFKKLSVTGSVANLYNALQYAKTMKGKKKLKKKKKK